MEETRTTTSGLRRILENAYVTPQRSTLNTTERHKCDGYYKKSVFQKDIKAKTGPANADALAWSRGKDVQNFNVSFAWGFYDGVRVWGAKPHTQVGDQFLVSWTIKKLTSRHQ